MYSVFRMLSQNLVRPPPLVHPLASTETSLWTRVDFGELSTGTVYEGRL